MFLKRLDILRSRNLFKQIASKGRRIDGALVRCSFQVHGESRPQLQVAFKVSSRKFNAVKRNRIKRLMRQSVDVERGILDAALQGKDLHVGLIILYKGTKDMSLGRLQLTAIQKDISYICRSIVGSL